MALLLSTNLQEAGWLDESRPQHQERTSTFGADVLMAADSRILVPATRDGKAEILVSILSGSARHRLLATTPD